MDIRAVPTDSLYKFMALAGLAVVLFVIAFASTRTLDLELRVVESRTESEILRLETSALSKEIETAEKNTQVAHDDISRLRAKALELAIKRARLEGRDEQTKVLLSDLRFSWAFLIVGGVVGIASSNVGFLLWYRRIQSPNDTLLRKQIERHDA